MKTEEIFKIINYPGLLENTYMISTLGRISLKDDINSAHYPLYHSSNGYYYEPLLMKDDVSSLHNKSILLPVDELVARTFVDIPDELKDCDAITVLHKNNDTGDNHSDNLMWVADTEQWRDVVYPFMEPGKYQISNFGNIRHTKSGYVSSSTSKSNSRGYSTFSFTGTDGKQHYTTKHKLLAIAFVQGCTDFATCEVNHIDGNKLHNHWKNLEWVSHLENMKHAFSNGFVNSAKGENAGLANMTNSTVHLICMLFIRCWGKSTDVLSMLKSMGYDNVSLKQIQHIKHKECWNWISDRYWDSELLDKLHSAKIHMICNSLVNNKGDVNKTLDDLKCFIPTLTKRFIQVIKYKESYPEISDLYFMRGCF